MTRQRKVSMEGLAMTDDLPMLLTVAEVAKLLRTTPRAIYAMIERGLLPGVTRVGRRLLIHRDDVLQWLDRNRAPSSKEVGRR